MGGGGGGGDERRTRVDSPQFKYTSPLLTCCSYFTHFQLQIQTFIAFLVLFFIAVVPCSRGADPDPDWIRNSIGSVDPDPDSESGFVSGSRRAKMTHKSKKNVKSSSFEVLVGLF